MKPLKKVKVNTSNKVIDKLYQAVIDYVEANGGSVAVIGGVAIVKEDERKYNYGLMVRITGKPITIKEKK